MNLIFDFTGEKTVIKKIKNISKETEKIEMPFEETAKNYDRQKVEIFRKAFLAMLDIAEINEDILYVNVDEGNATLEYRSKYIMFFTNVNPSVRKFFFTLTKSDYFEIYEDNGIMVMKSYYTLIR